MKSVLLKIHMNWLNIFEELIFLFIPSEVTAQ